MRVILDTNVLLFFKARLRTSAVELLAEGLRDFLETRPSLFPL